jgi:hypothetical protein
VNFHNTSAWVDDNPNTAVASRHQHWISIDVCVGILGDQLLESVVLLNRLTGAVYRRQLENDLPALLVHVSLHQQHLWFLHDVAQPYFLFTG